MSMIRRFCMISFIISLGKTSCFKKSMRSVAMRRSIESIQLLATRSKGTLTLPDEPINFQSKFFIPESNEKLFLEEENPHIMDPRISFDQTAHQYYFDGFLMDYSVTTVVAQFFAKFDADKIIKGMISGPKWPRPEYTQRNGKPYTAEEIKLKWDSNGEYARNTGTWMHYNIERYLNNLGVSPKSEEIPKFLKFYDEIIVAKGIQPFRTEWRIAAPDIGIAGSVDFVGKFPDGTYAIIDWKRSKDLGNSLNNKYGKRANYPLEHIDECDGSKYFLQLNLYRYILQKYYGISVSYMAVASFHPNTGETYFMSECPMWENEVEGVLKEIESEREEGVRTPELSPPRLQPQASRR